MDSHSPSKKGPIGGTAKVAAKPTDPDATLENDCHREPEKYKAVAELELDSSTQPGKLGVTARFNLDVSQQPEEEDVDEKVDAFEGQKEYVTLYPGEERGSEAEGEIQGTAVNNAIDSCPDLTSNLRLARKAMPYMLDWKNIYSFILLSSHLCLTVVHFKIVAATPRHAETCRGCTPQSV